MQTQTKEQRPQEQEVHESLIPHLKKKYLIILITLGVIAVMLPSYMQGVAMGISYVLLALIGALMLGLYTEFNFQQLHRKWRPYVVGKISKWIAIIWTLNAVVWTVPLASQSGEWIPYGVFWVLCGFLVWNHFQIFVLAKQHKLNHPDRCEFC